ncbi:MAG: LysR substrate-binding domain-containing protein, partial [Balneolaceae bacterium]|nr:LysR substrate-binding domain-containing protein [Balneolaceae bacterium]
REASRDMTIEFESGNLETLKQLVEQDFGMTLMPYLAINQIDEQCAKAYLRYFDEPAPRRKVRLAYSREFLKTNIIEAFANEIRECVPDDLKQEEEGVVVE